MHLTLSILGILLTIFFVIGTHEAAHFYMARLLGVKVLRFSIGFGKTLLSWTDKHKTEYVIALIPLGGYVRMLDETEGEVKPEELKHAFNRQPYYKKFLIVFAGPFTNILCAFLLYWLIFMIGFTAVKPVIGEVKPNSIAAQAGLKKNDEIISVDGRKTPSWTGIIFRLLSHTGDQDTANIEVVSNKKTTQHILNLHDWQIDGLTPDPLGSLGLTPYEPQIPLIIGVIAANSPALSSRLKLGDKILSIGNKPVKKWEDVLKTILEKPGETVEFKIVRDGKEYQFPVTLGYQRSITWQKSGYLGIAPKFKWPTEMLHKVQYSPGSALVRAGQEIKDFTYFNLLLFWKMITGKLSLKSLGGPITIFESAGDALNSGYLSFIAFLAFLSISIGIINFLPIPGLDGGHLFLYIIEVIIRRPIPPNVIELLLRLGFIFLMLLLVQALVNDILRLS